MRTTFYSIDTEIADIAVIENPLYRAHTKYRGDEAILTAGSAFLLLCPLWFDSR